MAKIKAVEAREILDSRGNPTVETKVILDTRHEAVASVPAGESLGKYEAVELRDGDQDRYSGMGVLKAVENVNRIIAPQLVGKDPDSQKKLDDLLIKLDGTENKSKLGANAILSVSQGICEAAALIKGLPIYRHVSELFFEKEKKDPLKIPLPTFNLINGGRHGAGNLEFQEFHIVPAPGKEYRQVLEMAEEVYQTVEKVLIRHGAIHSVGDEGGFAPNLFTNLDALEVIVEAINESCHVIEKDIYLGLDVAASHFYKEGRYKIRDRTLAMDTNELIEYYHDLVKQYPLALIEDPLHEDDWGGWSKLVGVLPDTVVVGDDLLATNKSRVEKAISEKACNALLAKPNQIGTISETIEVIRMVRKAGLKVVVSHRSGETNDDFIADFAVGVGADYTKFGAPARGERVAKYNRLSAIEEELRKTNVSS
ncbi:MAG TPA: phosphopyruvate hydratase [Candidatus Bathyarchaeia archaeon]|nr:phosphopyruvate hydratase [Candidatus Bathyarchaeia archaeon]